MLLALAHVCGAVMPPAAAAAEAMAPAPAMPVLYAKDDATQPLAQGAAASDHAVTVPSASPVAPVLLVLYSVAAVDTVYKPCADAAPVPGAQRLRSPPASASGMLKSGS